MVEEGHIPPRNHGRKEASAPMEYGTPLEILLIEMAFNFSLFPSPFIFTSLWLFFGTLTSLLIFFFLAFCLNKPYYNDFFNTFLSPKGQVLFSTAFNFMEEHSDYTVSLLLKDYYHKVDRPNQGQKLIQVHKVDGPHQGLRPQSTKWTDPTRVTNLYKSQNGRTPPRVMTPVHEMDGPNQGHKLIQVHKVDGPHQGSRPQST